MIDEHQDLKQRADELRKKGQFPEAIPLYKQLWEASGKERDKWIGWAYAQCLRKANQPQEALALCREVYGLDPDFEINNNLAGWCLYDLGIKGFGESFDEAEVLRTASEIIQFTKQGAYSPYERAVFQVVKTLESYDEKNKPVPHAAINEWLDKIDPGLLSKEPERGPDGKSYPSAKESWYRSRAKALLGLESYEDCVEICTEALGNLRTLHHDYDVWFRYYRAESLLQLGRATEALADLEYMMERKPDPWIRHRYALALRATGDIELAIQYAAEAALPPQRLEYRWEVYYDLGKMLSEAGEGDLAGKHFVLAAAIRQENGWDLPGSLIAAQGEMALSFEDLPPSKELHRELQSWWKSMTPRPQTAFRGVVKLLHGNGKSGILLGDSGTEYFFGVRSYKGDAALVPGLRVAFNLKQEANKRTGQPEMHAVDIVPEG